MDFRVLGALEVRDGDRPLALGGAKQRAVLAHLVLRANATVPAERLIDQVWGDEPPAAVRNVLQTYVSRLRKTLGPDRLDHEAGGYVLRARSEEIDARRFEALVETARRMAASDPAAAVALYREADVLWRGPALDDLAGQRSLRGEIAQLEERRIAATEQRIVAALAAGREAELVPELEALIARFPLREALWSHLMVALYRSGRQADALAAYRRARDVLVGELGIEPSAELRRLEQQVLSQDPALEPAGRPLRGFQLLERVGAGSFGVVHRALQPQVGREVAVKVIRPALANEPEFIRRFEAEAQLVARLEHPHVVPLYDYWRDPDGAYLVMRYLRGGSLRDLLAEGPLRAARALAVAAQVGSALAAAHRQGVVHRDVKPANVLLDEDGNAYLSDFGIARDVALARTPEREDTASSAYYLSPEEARGEPPTARADVYSLGVVLFEMLAGHHPFAGLAPEALEGARVPRLGEDVPAGLAGVVERATARDPAVRHADAAALVAALSVSERAVAAPAGPARNPYKGLRPFGEADAGDFHGREALIARLRGSIATTRLLALVGPSGSGKSSIAHAGLVPALRADGWFVARMQPGRDPMAELASALEGLATTPVAPGPGMLAAAARRLPGTSGLLLVIDQFEELFTLAGEDARATFLDELSAPSRAHMLLTLRADHLGAPLALPGFAEALSAGTELVLPMGPDELERAITGPAAQAGVEVEPGLVSALVTDVIGQPGALPLLQFTLAELFDGRREDRLTLADYRRLGGVGAAVARGAEHVHAGLGHAGRETARRLFLALVDLGDGGAARRRVARRELLVRDVEADAVLGAFASRRLLSLDRDPETREPTVEIAHDALLVAWERLGEWIAAADEDLRTRHRLAGAAAEWSEAGRDPSFLLRGARLERLAAWREETALAPAPVEHELLVASLAAESEQAARARALERRSLRRLRTAVGVLAGGVVVAGAVTAFALIQRAEADDQRRTAVARGLAAAAVASLGDDAERSVLLGLEAVRHTRDAGGTVLPEAQEALHRAVVASRIRLRVPGLGGATDWSPDGELFVTEGPENRGLIDIRDAATGRSVRAFHGHDVDVNLVAFSADGSRLATSGDDGKARVWDPRTGERLASVGDGPDQVWGAALSPDGERLAAAWWEAGVVRVFDVASERQVCEITGLDASLNTAFSPDGRRLAIATWNEGAVVVDASSCRRVGTLEGQGGVLDVDFSPDGRRIATTSPDASVRIWNARTLHPRFRITRHRDEVVAADWSADSRRLATGSRDGTAKVWEVGQEEVRELLTIGAQERGGGLWVAFSPDSDRLMTGDEGITAVKVWDVGMGGDAEWVNVFADPGQLGGAAFTPDGAHVAVSAGGGAVALWDPRTGQRAATLRPRAALGDAIAVGAGRDGLLAAAGLGGVRVWDSRSGRERFTIDVEAPGDAAWSPDGSLLAVGGAKGEVRIVDRSGKQRATLRGVPGQVTALRFSPNGRLLAVGAVPADGPGGAALWDWRRGRVVRTLPDPATAMAFSGDGRLVAVAPFEGPVVVHDASSGRVVARLSGHAGGANDVEFAPAGPLVATASADATIRLWDARTGRSQLVLRGHEGLVWDVAFSPDGSKLVSAGPDGVARVWALDIDDLIAIARRRVTRTLTEPECRQYRCGR